MHHRLETLWLRPTWRVGGSRWTWQDAAVLRDAQHGFGPEPGSSVAAVLEAAHMIGRKDAGRMHGESYSSRCLPSVRSVDARSF